MNIGYEDMKVKGYDHCILSKQGMGQNAVFSFPMFDSIILPAHLPLDVKVYQFPDEDVPTSRISIAVQVSLGLSSDVYIAV